MVSSWKVGETEWRMDGEAGSRTVLVDKEREDEE